MLANEAGQTEIQSKQAQWDAGLHHASAQIRRDPQHSGAAEPVSTGTTIVGLWTEDAIILGADRRASLGGRLVTSKQFDKLAQIHPTASMAITGTVGANQQLARMLRAEASLYEQRRSTPMSIQALTTLAGNVLSRSPMAAAPLIGGVDAAGPRLVSLDGAGGILDHEFTAGGSGMQFAYGVLEQEFHSDLSVESAKTVAAQSISAAIERDTASGNGIQLAEMTADSVSFAVYDGLQEVNAHVR